MTLAPNAAQASVPVIFSEVLHFRNADGSAAGARIRWKDIGAVKIDWPIFGKRIW